MFYGSIKFKNNWLGKRVWYGNCISNGKVVWKKIKPKRIQTLLLECGSNRFVSTEFVMGNSIRRDKVDVVFSVENNEVCIRVDCKFNGALLPLYLYDSATFKIKCNSRTYDSYSLADVIY